MYASLEDLKTACYNKIQRILEETDMGIVVIGAVYVDIKGFPEAVYIPDGRNVGRVEYTHGGVCRNVVENIANVELEPTFISLVDETALGEAVMRKLNNHKVDTRYMQVKPGGMGTWLAVFDNQGDLAGSISQRADLSPVLDILEQYGDEIFAEADSIVIQLDLDKTLLKKAISLAEKYDKKLFAVVSNMSIAAERRDLLKHCECFVCNQLEAGMFFAEDYSETDEEEMVEILAERIGQAKIPSMVVTMGGKGSVYASQNGEKGFCPSVKVLVKDTTGAGDAFFSGVTIGLTYGKDMRESVQIGAKLAASVIVTSENVCPRFLPEELGLDIKKRREKTV